MMRIASELVNVGRQTIAVLAVTLAVSAASAAHDFWLEPAHFSTDIGNALPFVLRVGDGAHRERSQIPESRIVRLDVIEPSGMTRSELNTLHLGGHDEDLAIRFHSPGLNMIVLQSDNAAISRLPAARFNAYLAAEGLEHLLVHREKTGSLDHDSSERYGRVAKSLVHIQGAYPKAAMVTRALVLPLDILLSEQDLERHRDLGRLSVRVLQQGAPLPGALVKLKALDGSVEVRSTRTDQEGLASFPTVENGRWLITTVSSRPAAPDDALDYESWFASLSFELGAH